MRFLLRFWFLTVLSLIAFIPGAAAAQTCSAQVAQWLNPADGRAIESADLLDRVVDRSIVLLGEVHDNPGHHRWQHYVMTALHSRRSRIVVGLEMLPRRAQPALDDWTAGELDAEAFLEQSGWDRVWGYDPELYLPLLTFAREHRLPGIALNVDRALVSRVGAEGWDAIEEGERFGLTDPAPASDEYRRYLGELFAYKMTLGGHGDEAADVDTVMQGDAFARFVEAQLTWDRAMAEALATAHRLDPDALVIGIVGRGHLQYGHGIPHQLADLGIDDVAVLLPVDADSDCGELSAGLADAVFVVESQPRASPVPKPRLGVMIEAGEDGVRVMEVIDDSVAAASDLRAGDVILRAAGFEAVTNESLIEIIQRQAPGTWLPLLVRREGRDIEIVARFPQGFE